VDENRIWRACSSCKKPIGLNSIYWQCNVSTCNRKRTGLAFCSVECWDAHVPVYNHRESWAIESRSPREKSEEKQEEENERETIMSEGTTEKEVLVVASKLKNYIRGKSGMNTSAAVIDVLSDKVRELCDQAVESAKRDGRKTVMDRDFT
jgi:histone H3/H4